MRSEDKVDLKYQQKIAWRELSKSMVVFLTGGREDLYRVQCGFYIRRKSTRMQLFSKVL
jgi:hypothetical protein